MYVTEQLSKPSLSSVGLLDLITFLPFCLQALISSYSLTLIFITFLWYFSPYNTTSMVKQLILDFSYKNRLPQSWGVQSCVEIESENLWIWISQEFVGFYLHFLFPGRDVSWYLLNFSSNVRRELKDTVNCQLLPGGSLVLILCMPSFSVFSCSMLYLKHSYTCQGGFFNIS